MTSIISLPLKNFAGTLSYQSDRVDVKFSVVGDAAAELSIVIERFPYGGQHRFIEDLHNLGGTKFAHFILQGRSEDGEEFFCDDIIFTALGNIWNKADGHSIAPVAHYNLANLTLNSDQEVSCPVLTWRLKGFESFEVLEAVCELGVIKIGGVPKLTDDDRLHGQLKISMPLELADEEIWTARAAELLEHVRDVMSFASGTYILVPTRELAKGVKVKVEAYSQGLAKKSDSPAFKSLALGDIFQCAVSSFFEPRVKIKNLQFAIKWFTMPSNYTEALLISSMTVLENLLDSNLTEEDVRVLSDSRYEILRRKISAVIKEDLAEWVLDKAERAALVSDLNERLVELKRRSLIDKLMILGHRWGVQLEDIPVKEIKEAKKARDHVVHRGYYARPGVEDDDVHDHVLTVRELVMRFILTGLGYSKTYWSYPGGYHSRQLHIISQ
ncbi:MAG: hypothetical protein RR775_09910 [Massilia sp.]|uniref:hypothetical protein n=1 Tax=Massilia sp. TaxID=1882437 RepID=UPI002FC65F79